MTVTALVTCAGAMPACAVINALKKQAEIEVEVVGIDQNPLSAGLYLCDRHFTAPSISDPAYIDSVLALCAREKIGIVFPIMDAELLTFALNRQRFADAGIKLVANDPAIVSIVRDKWRTYGFCRERGILAPKTFSSLAEMNGAVPGFPLIVKPRQGWGTMGVNKAADHDELEFYFRRTENPIIQEYIAGQEYTIDVVTDLSGQVIAVVPKARLETKAGMQVKGRTVKDDELIAYGQTIAKQFGLDLRFNVQCIRSSDKLYLIEVNAKFPASLPFTVAAGVNAPLLILKMLLGQKIEPMIGRFAENLTMLRYWQEIFV